MAAGAIGRDKGNGKETMPYLKIPVLLPSQGLDYSRPATLLNDSNCFPQNMAFYRGDIRKRDGTSQYGDSPAIPDAPVMGLGKMELSSGLRYLVRASTTGLQFYNEITNAWDDITVTPYSGTANDYFDFANDPDDNFLIIVNGVDQVRYWTGSGDNQLLGGNPGIAGTAAYLAPYVLLGNMIQDVPLPYNVQWCDTGNPQIWTGGNSGAQALSDEPTALLKLKKLNEFCAAYKKNSLWLGRTDVNDVFDFVCVKTGVGLISKNAVREVEAVHYFMGQNDFYSWDGATLSSIGSSVRDEVFSTIDKTQTNKFFAIHVQSQTEVWFFVVTLGQTFPTQVWKYNYRWNIWYFDTCANLTAGIDFQDSLADRVVLGDSSGFTYKVDGTTFNDNGVPVSCSVATKDFVADNKFNEQKRWLQLDIWAYGTGTLWVDYSTDRGVTWMSIDSAALASAMPTIPITMFFDVVSSHIRFRFRNSNSEETFFLRKFFPYYLYREESWR